MVLLVSNVSKVKGFPVAFSYMCHYICSTSSFFPSPPPFFLPSFFWFPPAIQINLPSAFTSNVLHDLLFSPSLLT